MASCTRTGMYTLSHLLISPVRFGQSRWLSRGICGMIMAGIGNTLQTLPAVLGHSSQVQGFHQAVTFSLSYTLTGQHLTLTRLNHLQV